jgi:hypothetical protein
LGRPDLTAARFVPDPFGAERGETGGRLYRTGDLARALPNGDLEFLGRIDLQVKVRGVRVELGEVEVALGEHPGVRQAAVTAPVLGGLRCLVAYVVPAGEALAPGELRSFLAARLPDSMVPSRFVFLDALPLGATGKVDRRSLPPPDAGGTEEGAGYVAPRTPFEALVAEAWAEALGRERVGIHDNFWDLGGHSLLATRVLARISRDLGVELPLQTLFKRPTVAELTAVIGEVLLEDAGEES